MQADAEEMLEKLHAYRGGMLAGELGAFAKGVGDFGDAGDVAASENFDEDFVAERAELAIFQGGAADEEKAAHGVGDFAGDFGEHHEAEKLRGAGDSAMRETPVADAAAFDVTAGDGEVGFVVGDGAPEVLGGLRGVLEVGVHHAENFAAGDLPTAEDGGGEAALALAADGADLRVALRELLGDLPGVVRGVVVDDDDFVGEGGDGVERGDRLVDDGFDVGGFVVSGKDQREAECVGGIGRGVGDGGDGHDFCRVHCEAT